MSQLPLPSHRFLTLAAIVPLVLADEARGDYLPVFGSPPYQASNYSADPPPRVNNAGTAVGLAHFDFRVNVLNNLPVWWDGSGGPPVLLDHSVSRDGRVNAGVWAINDAGVIVGATEIFGEDLLSFGRYRAIRWDGPQAAATELGILEIDVDGNTLGYQATAINSTGTVVGYAFKTGEFGPFRAVRWDASSNLASELMVPGEFGNDYYSEAYDINDAGVAIGRAGRIGQGHVPIRWDAPGVPTILDSLGHEITWAFAINNAGTIVGQDVNLDANGSIFNHIAIRWDPGEIVPTKLRGLGSDADGHDHSHAWKGINDAGDIVGSAEKFDEFGNSMGHFAVRWDAGTDIPIELDHLGEQFGEAHAINAAGVAVGGITSSPLFFIPRDRAVYWRRDGTAVDLNTLIDPNSGWVLRYASDISDTGWITGVGQFDPDGSGGEDPYWRYFLIHVPEAAVPLSGIPGDYNSNGTVEQGDLDLVLLNWGSDIVPAAWRNDLPTGAIDQEELDKVLLGWGNTTTAPASAAAVPEPATVLVLLIGLAVAAASRLAVCIRPF